MSDPIFSPCLHTIKDASRILGVQYRQLLESVNQGEVLNYRIQKSRRLVRLDEVLAVMRSPQAGEVQS